MDYSNLDGVFATKRTIRCSCSHPRTAFVFCVRGSLIPSLSTTQYWCLSLPIALRWPWKDQTYHLEVWKGRYLRRPITPSPSYSPLKCLLRWVSVLLCCACQSVSQTDRQPARQPATDRKCSVKNMRRKYKSEITILQGHRERIVVRSTRLPEKRVEQNGWNACVDISHRFHAVHRR